jgi:hypothetical protein
MEGCAIKQQKFCLGKELLQRDGGMVKWDHQLKPW